MDCTVEELRNVCLWPSGGIQVYPTEDMDEVYPGLFLGDASSASDIDRLLRLDVGYVLNSAHGHDSSLNLLQVHSEETYSGAGLAFLGVPALDMTSYPLDGHFRETTRFIQRGRLSGRNVLVHCKQGISRSAALVLAYLVQAEGLDVKSATRMVRERREILPNDGFLMQLCNIEPKNKQTAFETAPT